MIIAIFTSLDFVQLYSAFNSYLTMHCIVSNSKHIDMSLVNTQNKSK